MRTDKKLSLKADKKSSTRGFKQGIVGYSKKTALLEEAITRMNAGKYGRSSEALKELLALDPHNMEARRLFATLHLRLGSLILARQAFDSLIDEAFGRQDYWLAESLLREYLTSGPRCVPYLEKLGSIHQDKGEVLEAVAEYGKAIDILIEDPDPDNPHHASQLYAKIKDLAPANPVAVRLAGSFDVQTGELIARPPASAASPSPWTEESAAEPMAAAPIVGAVPWEQAGNALPIQEAAVSAYPQDVPVDVSAGLPREEPVLGDTLPPCEPLVNGYGSINLECEATPTGSEDSSPLETEQFRILGGPSQDIQQEAPAEAVPVPMPWEDIREATIGIPDQTGTESSYVASSLSAPEQAPTGLAPETSKGGEFSWDALFQNIPKFGSALSISTPTPEMEQNDLAHIEEPPAPAVLPADAQEVDSRTIEILEADSASLSSPAAEFPPAVAPMPWDQVQESAITIPQEQTEESVVEHQVEPAQEFHEEPVHEQDRPPSINSATADAPNTDAFSFMGSSPASEPESAPVGSPQVLPAMEDRAAAAATEQEPSAFSFASESLKPVEPVAVEPLSVFADLPPPVVEAAPPEPQHEIIFFPSNGDSVESAPDPHAGLPEFIAEPKPASPLAAEDFSNWKAGEAAVRTHRLSSNKRKEASEPAPEMPKPQALPEETTYRRTEQEVQPKPAFASANASPQPTPQPKDWIKTGESIRFVGEPPVSPVEQAAPETPLWGGQNMIHPAPVAAAAVDVLFGSSGRLTQTGTRDRAAQPKPRQKLRSRLNRLRIALSAFIGSCFSTTRAIVTSLIALLVLSCVLVALGIGAVGLAWIIMEKPSSPAFNSLTTSPQRTVSDVNKNGYLLLLGFDAPSGQDPIQAGYERKPDGKDADKALACLGGSGNSPHAGQSNGSAKVLSGWFRGSDPVGRFKSHQGAIEEWASQGKTMLSRYKRWQQLSFEDWGYGQSVSPPCASINFAHHLYVAEGFVQGADIGIDRLEIDMEAWRIALGQAKTLPVKTLALQAINDDIAVASGLLVQPDFDGKYLGRLAKMLRPLDQVELSIRWPMQSELVYAAKTFDAQLKAERAEEQAIHAVIASALPLPKQRRLNDYAEYYEASYKASSEGRYGTLPKWGDYIRFPGNTVMDYFTNPIENIIGLEPLAPWDLYNGLVIDTDAHLRLASLQAWIRRGPQDADLLPRMAKAGQKFYDPFTGLPMLVNLKKGVLYSVGHDGKDQDADPQSDVVVAIPVN